ncbi:MAG: outer membrane protein assembly factor BamD [Gammaproteobacteria bacterium]|nr:outer membrane protein assembly factor BamD [Gammaproteobacteria bacterium]MBU1653529.1 outer membrane protein assembly factor BamD [Gammaproteobacteria bacterium]MBU1961651.1 outer membrane protein assembly factor BamD [Gammaproteobacteria bacterium]
MNRSGYILLLMVFSLLSGCISLFGNEEDKTRNWSAQRFYSEASTALNEGDYQKAIKYYEMLEARFPFGKYAMQAQLDVAYAYYKDAEPESAIAAADRFIRTNPRNPRVDYAYYLKGLVNFNRSIDFMTRFLPTDISQRDSGAAVESFRDFGELVRRYPDSQYAKDARIRMVYLHNLVAQHEVHVASYYMKKGAYLAAANRCKEVVEKYQRAPAVEQALELMVQAYTKLELPKLAEDAQRVLALNREKGGFAQNVEKPEDRTMVRVVWDYIGLDQN